MAILFDASSNKSQDSGSTVTWSHTCSGLNRILLVGANMENNSTEANMTVSGITYNSVALTKIDAQTVSNKNRAELWYLLNPSTGANNIVVTCTGDNDYACGAVSFTGASQVSQPNASAKNSDTSTSSLTVTVDVTSTVSNCMVVDVANVAVDTRTCTVGTGQTERVNVTNAGSLIGLMSTEPMTGIATATMSWTISVGGSQWANIAAIIHPAVTGGFLPFL